MLVQPPDPPFSNIPSSNAPSSNAPSSNVPAWAGPIKVVNKDTPNTNIVERALQALLVDRAAPDLWRFKMLLFMMLAIMTVASVKLSGLALQAIDDPDDLIVVGSISNRPIDKPDIYSSDNQPLAVNDRLLSIYAEPHKILDIEETKDKLTGLFPDLSDKTLEAISNPTRKFVWISRKLSLDYEDKLITLGLPGLGFRYELGRSYPQGNNVAHVVGTVNIANRGVVGLERYLDESEHSFGKRGKLRLSIDTRVQHVVRLTLQKYLEQFSAQGVGGLIMDLDSREIVAAVSMPDFDPTKPGEAIKSGRINRLTKAIYELGSVNKILTFAAGFELGMLEMRDIFNANGTFRIGGINVTDYKGKNRELTTPEVFIYSSNIGSARIAESVGKQRFRNFLHEIGLFDEPQIELKEIERGHEPKNWTNSTLVTSSFGYGLSTTILNLATSVANLITGEIRQPTFVSTDNTNAQQPKRRLVSEDTSRKLLDLMRLNVLRGTGSRADVPGVNVGGKTGTASKFIDGAYDSDKNVNSFLAVFPSDKPRYILVTMIDNPRDPASGKGLTAGRTSAPMAGDIIRRVVPLLGVVPNWSNELDDRLTRDFAMLVR